MDATSLPPNAPLPDDVAALQRLVRELLAEVARLRAANAELQGKLDAALKQASAAAPSAGPSRGRPPATTGRRRAATSTAAPPCPPSCPAARSSTT
jgi:hypothetical protein